jgi:hypothetical protein
VSGSAVERAPVGVTGAPVRFELERFEVTGDRLEISGRWFGVRGMRFVRPSLLLRSPDGERPLLALLEHKPWAAIDGAPWLAAFPWRGGEADPARARLAVAQNIVVPLAEGGDFTPDPLETAREQLAIEAQRAARLEAEVSWLREQHERLVAERDEAAAEREAVTGELQGVRRALERVTVERDTARTQDGERAAELDGARAERDDAQAQFQTVVDELERARAELEKVLREQDEAAERREAADRAREAAVQERDTAIEERDAAARERAVAVRDRKALVHEREAAIRERDAAREQAEALARDLTTVRRELASAARQLAGVRKGMQPGEAAPPAEQRDPDATRPLEAAQRPDADAPEQHDPDATRPLDAARRPDAAGPDGDPDATQPLEADATQPLAAVDRADAGTGSPGDAAPHADPATEPVAPKPRRRVVITDPAVAERPRPGLTDDAPPTPGPRQVPARIVAAIALLVFAVVLALIVLKTL